MNEKPHSDLELIFLGSGTSAGIPMIGCRCAVCTSSDPRDQRTRPSVLIRFPAEPSALPPLNSAPGVSNATETVPDRIIPFDQRGERHILIDSSPDMRLQMVRHQINHLDAVLYTHAHADHIFGIDDLRRFNAVMHSSIDVYAEAHTAKTMRSVFRYIFEPESNINKTFIASLEMKIIEPGVPLHFFDAAVTPVRLMHGNLPIVGYRVDRKGGSIGYCTDVSMMPEETMAQLRNLDVLVIDSLRYLPHPTHLSLDQALEIIGRLKPRRAYLTHIAHDIMHAELEPRLPEGVHIGYDGLIVAC